MKIKLLIIIGIAIMACSSAEVIKRENSQKELSIQVVKNQAYTIQLETQLGTGYSWKAVDISENVKISSEKIISNKKNIPGGKEVHEFIFVKNDEKEGFVMFHYSMHWDEETSPADTFQVNLISEK